MERLKDCLRKYSAEKKGSYVVFITMIFLSVIIFAVAVIQASVQTGVQSTAESLGYLWGQSILAEYDNFCFERYGLLAFAGDEYETAEKIEYYAQYTCDDKKYVNFSDTEVKLEGYEITDTVNLRRQIERAVATCAQPVPKYRTESGDSVQEPTDQIATTSVNRYVSAEWIVNELPSHKGRISGNVDSIISAIKESASLGSITAIPFVNSYIMKFFKHRASDNELGDTYFDNEVEYIISGKLDDKKAVDAVERILVAYREIMNCSHINKSKKKSSALTALAKLLFPEVPILISKPVLITAWAAAETVNDIRLLADGKPVPFVKKDENFALSLESVIKVKPAAEGTTPEYEVREDGSSKGANYVEPNVLEGETYEDYLWLILTFIPEKVIDNRILDLIQINGKYLYVDYFNINRCYTGLDYSFTVNGKKHEFTEKY